MHNTTAHPHAVPSTIPGLLRHGAQQWPDKVLASFEDGSSWTWQQCFAQAHRAANGLRERGIEPGHRVMIMLPNGAPWLRAWWGSALLGGIVAPINPAYRGQMLADLCDTVAPHAIVTDGEGAARLPSHHRRVLIADSALTEASSWIPTGLPEAQPWDTHCLLMTSGTTGPSKASVTTHAYVCNLLEWIVEGADLSSDDVFQADMPWFHLSALAPAVQMMRVGGRIAVRTQPAMSRYWEVARELGSTFATAAGTVAHFLEAQPPSAHDRDHRMRFMFSSPLPANPQQFIDRFGLRGLCTTYGSTEANLVVINTLKFPLRPGSCGKARPGFQVRIVDEHDHEVSPGQVGELIARCEQPWLQSQGYFNNPEATVSAWRNGWIHTGDAMRVDEDGYYYFHDRYKDALRRRGENISSFEVEREVLAYPAVAEVACVATPCDYGADDEVKVFVVPHPDTELDLEDLLRFLVDRMPYFMVPRYFELITELPKTPTQRVQKHLLRAQGNTTATWDRENAGYRLTRSGLVNSKEATTTPRT